MNPFDWTYDIEAEVIHIGSKFRIDITTVVNSDMNMVDNWSNGEFIEFEITWIGLNMTENGRLICVDNKEDDEIVMLVVNDCNMPTNSIYKPGHNQGVPVDRVRELVNCGYWRHL